MRQNFEPTIWGPHAWFFLETITMAYPENPDKEDIKNTKMFFNSLQYVIPCEKCRKNYNKHLKLHPLNDNVLKDRSSLFKWIVDVHNSVDYSKKKKYDEDYRFYTNKYSDEPKQEISNNFEFTCKIKNIITVSLIVTFIIVLYKIYLYFTI